MANNAGFFVTVFRTMALTALLIVVLMLIYFSVKPIVGVVSASGWQETVCTILQLESHTSRDNRNRVSHAIRGSYYFEVSGVGYQSDRFDFARGSYTFDTDSEAMAQSLKTNAQVPCFYNPNNPDESVIDRNWRWEMAWMPGILGTMFLIFWWIGFFDFLKKKQPSRTDF